LILPLELFVTLPVDHKQGHHGTLLASGADRADISTRLIPDICFLLAGQGKPDHINLGCARFNF